jgi:glycosyltransferase involved in cell wall biosynthesis
MQNQPGQTQTQSSPQPPRPQQQSAQEGQQKRPAQRPARRWRGNRQHPQQRTEVSVVIPLYNEELSLRELYDALRRALNFTGGRYEILFIDDGSTDGSQRVLRDLRSRDGRVKVIRFRRNYGKSAALSVGFQRSKGEYVVTMDADLQDDPIEISRLISEIKKGYDLVSGWKKKRHDPITKTIPSRFFNFITSVFTGIRIHDFNCGLKVYRKEVVKEIKVYGELHRYIPVLAHWRGFNIAEIVVQHHPRKYGKTKFGIGRFWKGFLDLLTTLFTTRYFRRPLHLFGLWGMTFVITGLVIVVWLIVEWFMGETALSNRPLFLVGVVFIIVGIQFVSIGLLGEMITKTEQTSEQEYSIREILE